MEAVDDKEMSLDASSFYAKKGGVVDSSDDETEGPGASGRGAPGKIMIEIKPLSAMTNAKTNEKPLDAFSSHRRRGRGCRRAWTPSRV